MAKGDYEEVGGEIIVSNCRKVWDLFKQMKKPETTTEKVYVKNDEEVAAYKEEINRLKCQLAGAEVRAVEAEYAAKAVQEYWDEKFAIDIPVPFKLAHPLFKVPQERMPSFKRS